ncbi:unnamed protein product [Chrysoparadoxa australica]
MLVPLPGVQALAGLEVIAAGIAGHLPGVLLGGALFASKTGAVTDNLPTSLLPSINAASGPLTVWAALALLVRVVTFSQDSRYLTFPSDVRHPMGCTRLTTDRPSRTGSLQVPVLNAEPSFVQHEASEWLKSQSFTTIKVEEEGYIYGKPSYLAMGSSAQRLKEGRERLGHPLSGQLPAFAKRCSTALAHWPATRTRGWAVKQRHFLSSLLFSQSSPTYSPLS